MSVNGISRPSLARLNSNGTLDTTFVPASGGSSMALQQDGKVLVTSQGLQPTIFRLNSGGSVDPSFQCDLTNVRFLFIQSDGKVIASEDVFFGEQFTTLRLNSDGSIDPSFVQQAGLAIGLDASDRVLVVTNGVGFQRLNTDGTVDSTFQPDDSLDCSVISIAEQPDNKLIVAGGSCVNEPFGIRRLLADGQADSTFNLGTGLTTTYGGWIEHAQLMPDGKIIVSGSFTHIDSLPRTKLARLDHDGTPDPDFDAGGLAYYNPGLLAPQADGKVLVAIYSDIFRLQSTGEPDPSFYYTPPTYTYVGAMVLQPDGKILVGHSDAFLRLNADGTPDPSFDPGLDAGRGISQILLQPDGKILINGSFSSIHGTPRARSDSAKQRRLAR